MHQSYKNISQISFAHDAGDKLKSLELIPTQKTQQILNNYKILFKQKGSDFFFLQSYKTEDTPLIEIEEILRLRFFLKFDYSEVITTSNLEMYSPMSSCLFLDDEQDEIELGSKNIIPKLKTIPGESQLKTLYDEAEVSNQSLRDGVFLDANDNSHKAFFSFSHNDKSGFLDFQIQANSVFRKIEFKLKARNTYVQYVVFDRHKQYSNFEIKCNTLEFSKDEEQAKTILTSVALVPINNLREHTFSLVGERKNGRKITLKEHLALPNLNNLNKDESENFVVSSFIYV